MGNQLCLLYVLFSRLCTYIKSNEDPYISVHNLKKSLQSLAHTYKNFVLIMFQTYFNKMSAFKNEHTVKISYLFSIDLAELFLRRSILRKSVEIIYFNEISGIHFVRSSMFWGRKPLSWQAVCFTYSITQI